MTSKEALERLCSRCYIESEQCTCHPRYKGGVCYTSCEYKEAIEQDLDRLEKLEKVIEILKENLHISFVKEPIYPNCANYYINQYNKFGNGCLTIITKEQYELLKEVLNNEQ